MKLTLQQAFYGHSDGYRLLGSSNPEFDTVVERLCNQIGTYDGESHLAPFYINWSDGNQRYMICCNEGARDAVGRITVFFHALIADESELRQNNCGIDNLIDQGAFVSSFKGETVAPISFETKTTSPKEAISPFRWSGEKIAIVTEAPDLDIIRSLLGDKLNTINWASYSFAPLKDFQLYVISRYVGLPADRNCLATNGMLLARPGHQTQQGSILRQPPTLESRPAPKKPHTLSFTKIAAILILTILLGVLTLWITNRRQSVSGGENIGTKQGIVIKDSLNIKKLREEIKKKEIKSIKEDYDVMLPDAEGQKKGENKDIYLGLDHYIEFADNYLFVVDDINDSDWNAALTTLKQDVPEKIDFEKLRNEEMPIEIRDSEEANNLKKFITFMNEILDEIP